MAFNAYGQVPRQQLYQSQPQHRPQPQPQSRQQAAHIATDQGGRGYPRGESPYTTNQTRNAGYNAQQDWQSGQVRQDARWEEQRQYQSFPDQMNGYDGYTGAKANAVPQDAGQTQGRVYQYDDRYHNDISGNLRQNGNRQAGREAQNGAKQKSAQADLRKPSKSRERILTRPLSPETLSWDNPFPTFGPNKKAQKKKHSSLDKDVGNLNLHDDRSSEARPHTSHSTRPPADSRPHTSHDQRQPDREPVFSPAIPQKPPMSPLRKDPPKGYMYGQAAEPTRPALNPRGGAYAQRSGSLRDQAFSELEQGPERSMTDPQQLIPPVSQRVMPSSASVNSYRQETGRPNHGIQQPVELPSPEPGRSREDLRQPAELPSPDPGNPYRNIRQPVELPSNDYVDPGQFGTTASRSRSNDLRHAQGQVSQPHHAQYSNLAVHEMDGNYEEALRHSERKAQYPHEPDMPKFEAIAAPISEKYEVEDHLQPTHSQPVEQPAYRKKAYQALQNLPQQSEENQQGLGQRSQTVQSPFSGFQFDLPRNQPSLPNGPNTDEAHFRTLKERMPPQYLMNNGQNQQQYESQSVRVPPQSQHPAAQFPPRSASRMPPQPRSASDAHQYPPQPQQLKQQRSFSEQQQWQKGRQDSANMYRQPAGRGGYMEDTYAPQQYNTQARPPPVRGYQDNYDQQYDQQYDEQYDQQYPMNIAPTRSRENIPRPSYDSERGPRPYAAEIVPTRSRENIPRPSYDSEKGPRPSTSGSGRPPPIRNYDQQGTSSPAPGQANRLPAQRSPDSLPMHPAPVRAGPRSPDALPMHPVPVRPGLMNQNANVPQHSQVGHAQQQPRTGTLQQGAIALAPIKRSDTEPTQKETPLTANDLKILQQTIQANPNDHATALRLAKKLVEAASVLASEGGKADSKTTAKNRERYIFDAHKQVKKLVNAGYPEAMFYLADCHGQGLLGLQVDPKEAFHLYTSAAKLGHPQAAYRVAVCCEMGAEEGGGTRRDPLKAMQWYKRAATLGDVAAMYKMGMMQLKGLLGQPKNPHEALSWLKRAAERADKENPHALHELGLLYESASPNDAIIRDEAYSRQLFTQAAELGYKYSQFRLGSAYEYGMLGCPVDARQSIAWYSRAAQQGEHQSELALSGWYLTGAEGLVEQSDAEAYLWARKAGMSGLAKAEYAMGYFTEVGIGVTANLEEAKRWYWKAASQNFPKARERLEDLKKGGGKQQRTRVSRSAVSKSKEGECVLM